MNYNGNISVEPQDRIEFFLIFTEVMDSWGNKNTGAYKPVPGISSFIHSLIISDVTKAPTKHFQ